MARRLVAESDRADTAGRELAVVRAQLDGVRRAIGGGDRSTPTTAVVRKPVNPAVPVIEEWVRQCTMPGMTPGRELYTTFTRWPGLAGITETMFGRTLTGAGFPPTRTGSRHCRPLIAVPELMTR